MKNLLMVAVIFVAGTFFQASDAHNPIQFEPATAFAEDLPGGAYLIFAGKFGGELSPKDIAGQKTLEVKGCAEGSVIYQFTLYVKKNGRTTSHTGQSNQLTPAMHNALKSLSSGDEFSFKNVKAHLPRRRGEVDVWAKAFYIA